MGISIRRRQLPLATAAWFGASVSAAAPTAASPPPDDEAALTYRALRGARGHFDGGPWNDDIDRWQGRKHVAMQRLAEQVLRQRPSANQLRRRMGEPDAVLKPGQAAHLRALEQAQWQGGPDGAPTATGKNAVLWLYRWRGRHDQLAFALEHDRVLASGWLHQWE